MLHDFISSNRDELIARTRPKVPAEPRPASSVELELLHGVPRFLMQLSETLRLETTSMPSSSTAIGATAAEHGRDLLAMGYTTLRSSTITATYARPSRSSRSRRGRPSIRRSSTP